MPRIPRTRTATDWRLILGALLFSGGALLWIGDAMRAMASS
jgi:hypothetical protein